MDIEALLGYRFTQKRLLEEALTHPGCAQTSNGLPFNYQRLEFLGDAVLGMVVAEIVYSLYPKENEGSLAKRHAALVRRESLVLVAQEIGIAAYMVLGDESGRSNASNLEDACEAIIGAMYLDGGMEPVRAFIRKHWLPLAELVQTAPKDAKTTLQEWAQGRGLPLPVYKVSEVSGPAHSPEFTVEAIVETKGGTAMARSSSKKQAEQLAAAGLLKILGVEG